MIHATPAKLHEENTALKGQVRELECENANLRLKVRALELAQARPCKPDDDKQYHLEISHTESVVMERDGIEEAAPEPTIPSSTTKRRHGRRSRARSPTKCSCIRPG